MPHRYRPRDRESDARLQRRDLATMVARVVAPVMVTQAAAKVAAVEQSEGELEAAEKEMEA